MTVIEDIIGAERLREWEAKKAAQQAEVEGKWREGKGTAADLWQYINTPAAPLPFIDDAIANILRMREPGTYDDYAGGVYTIEGEKPKGAAASATGVPRAFQADVRKAEPDSPPSSVPPTPAAPDEIAGLIAKLQGGGGKISIRDTGKLDMAPFEMALRNASEEERKLLISALQSQDPMEVLNAAQQARDWQEKNPRKKVDWGVKSGNWVPGVSAAVEGLIEGWKHGGSPARGLLYVPGAVNAAVAKEQEKLDKDRKTERDEFMQILGLEQGDVASRNASRNWTNQRIMDMAKANAIPFTADREIAKTRLDVEDRNLTREQQRALKEAELQSQAADRAQRGAISAATLKASRPGLLSQMRDFDEAVRIYGEKPVQQFLQKMRPAKEETPEMVKMADTMMQHSKLVGKVNPTNNMTPQQEYIALRNNGRSAQEAALTILQRYGVGIE